MGSFIFLSHSTSDNCYMIYFWRLQLTAFQEIILKWIVPYCSWKWGGQNAQESIKNKVPKEVVIKQVMWPQGWYDVVVLKTGHNSLFSIPSYLWIIVKTNGPKLRIPVYSWDFFFNKWLPWLLQGCFLTRSRIPVSHPNTNQVQPCLTFSIPFMVDQVDNIRESCQIKLVWKKSTHSETLSSAEKLRCRRNTSKSSHFFRYKTHNKEWGIYRIFTAVVLTILNPSFTQFNRMNKYIILYLVILAEFLIGSNVGL